MATLRVHNMAMSLDGYVAGPEQSLDNPLGLNGTKLHEWVFAERDRIDDDFVARGDDHLDGAPEGYECVELVSSPSVAHVRLSPAQK